MTGDFVVVGAVADDPLANDIAHYLHQETEFQISLQTSLLQIRNSVRASSAMKRMSLISAISWTGKQSFWFRPVLVNTAAMPAPCAHFW